MAKFLLTSFFVLSVVAQAQTPKVEGVPNDDLIQDYAAGKFSKSWERLKKDFTEMKNLSPEEIENRVEMANDIYTQDPSLNVADLKEVYDLALKSSPSIFLKKRLEARSAALVRVQRKPIETLDEADLEITRVLSGYNSNSSLDPAQHEKLAALWVTALSLEKKSQQSHTKEPRRLFLLGKAKHFESNSGKTFFEEFLEEAPKKGFAQERKTAFLLLRSSYEKSFPKGIPSDVAMRLKELRKKTL